MLATNNGTRTQLLAIYLARVRSVLEFATPVFSTSLTKAQSRQIESVQKKAFAIILGREYSNYESALKILGQERLSTRRTNLCYSFALKCSMSKKHASMFPLNDSPNQNTRNRKPFLEFKCNTSRYYNSPIPSLTRLLNNPPVPQTEWIQCHGTTASTIRQLFFFYSCNFLLWMDYEIC